MPLGLGDALAEPRSVAPAGPDFVVSAGAAAQDDAAGEVEQDLTRPPVIDTSVQPLPSQLEPAPEEREDMLEAVVTGGQTEFRLPDLGTSMREEQETRDTGQRIDVAFLNLFDPALPDPAPSEFGSAYNILIAGVGGTGVVTASGLIGLAAHLEGKFVLQLDQTGLAQKFGAVLSHVRIARERDRVHGMRIPHGQVDLLLGADLMVATDKEPLAMLSAQRSSVIVNTPPASVISVSAGVMAMLKV